MTATPPRTPAGTPAGGVPGTVPSFLVLTTSVLDQARTFFESRGVDGCEGTALIAGTEGDGILVGDTLVIPDQEATPTPNASVTVTPTGDLQLVTALRPDQLYLARIHSHPGLAFHSRTDDRNPALTHDGAISIVVPYFGLGLRRGLDGCAIYLRERRQWRELPAGTNQRDQRMSVHG